MKKRLKFLFTIILSIIISATFISCANVDVEKNIRQANEIKNGLERSDYVVEFLYGETLPDKDKIAFLWAGKEKDVSILWISWYKDVSAKKAKRELNENEKLSGLRLYRKGNIVWCASNEKALKDLKEFL